jgi:hypothetical protein
LTKNHIFLLVEAASDTFTPVYITAHVSDSTAANNFRFDAAAAHNG